MKNGTREILYWRYRILRLVGYLFAGAQDDSLHLINHDAAGLVGKISLLTPGLFGDADTPEKVSKLILLDVDTTAIPTNGQGIIKTAKSSEVTSLFAKDYSESFDPENLTACGPDFTSHIEPAWGYDVNLVHVVYRYKGRLVQKVDPLETEEGVLRWWAPTLALNKLNCHRLDCATLRDWIFDQYTKNNGISTIESANSFDCTPSMAILPHLDYCGGFIYHGPSTTDHESPGPVHADNPCVIIIRTKGLSKARACILTMYSEHFHDEAASLLEFPWSHFFPSCIIGATSSELVVLT